MHKRKKLDNLVQQEGVSTYHNIHNIIIHAPNGDLPAQLFMEGHCFPESDTQVKVGFTTGTLSLRKDASIGTDEMLKKLWGQNKNVVILSLCYDGQ